MAKSLILRVVVGVFLVGSSACTSHLGYRWSYGKEGATGIYGGPRVDLGVPLASSNVPADDSAYVDVDLAYNIATGPDFVLLGGGVAGTAGLSQLMLSVAWDFDTDFDSGLSAALCGGWGSYGVLGACGRWGSKGYIGAELMGGLNSIGIFREGHEECRLEGKCGDGDWD